MGEGVLKAGGSAANVDGLTKSDPDCRLDQVGGAGVHAQDRGRM